MKTTSTLRFKCPIMRLVFLNFILGFTCLNAQIIYTDIVPDFVSQNIDESYNLDINNDFFIDYTITFYNGPQYSILSSTYQGSLNGIASNGNPLEPLGKPLDVNTVIVDSELYFLDGVNLGIEMCASLPYYCPYDWQGATNKYFGFRFQINGQTHYGWARIDVTSSNEWIIKDYAYQASPDISILAGQMSTLGLNDSNTLNNIKVTTSNKIISVNNLNEIAQYRLFSISGQCVLKGTISKENNVIDSSVFSTGIYVIELSNPQTGQTIKKKLVI